MADQKLSALLPITSAQLAANDLLLVSDIDAAESKSILVSELDQRFDASFSAITSKSASYILATDDQIVICTTSGGVMTITLPTAVGATGKAYTIKKIGTATDFNSVTIDGDGSETIDGLASIKIFGAGESVIVVSDGTGWIITDWTSSSLMSHTMVYPGTSSVANNTSFISFEKGYMFMDCLVSFSGVAGAGNFTATVPVGPVIDTNKLSGGTNLTNTLFTQLTMSARVFDTASWNAVFGIYATSTTILFRTAAGILLHSSLTSGESVQFLAKVPVI